ncbi:MAG TPA: hemerythrin domain-containing protein [Anaeromyxobacteraceae bacterium]|nr:hemerythrin domain-containing protein [Anaeromyxobacteraceae bacterium]
MIEGHAWSDWLEVGDGDLDNDHHLQMRLVSSLIDAMEEGRPWLAHRLADHLRDSSAAHFATEEERMMAGAYPDRLAHRREHDALVGRLDELVSLVDAEDGAAAVAAAIDLRSALANHIGTSDRRLASHEAALRERASSNAP